MTDDHRRTIPLVHGDLAAEGVYDGLWAHLVDAGLITVAEARDAADRQQRHGGAPDTAILETRGASRESRRRLAAACAAWLQVPVATDAELQRPAPDALRRIPSALARHHALLATAVVDDALVVVAPVLPPHVISEVEFVVGRSLTHHLALEIDVREALVSHLHAPLSARFMALTHTDLHTPTPGQAGEGPIYLELSDPPLELAPELLPDDDAAPAPRRPTPLGGFAVVNPTPTAAAPEPQPAVTREAQPVADARRPGRAPASARRRVVLRFEEPSATPLPVIRPTLDQADDLPAAVAALADPSTRAPAAERLRSAGARALDALLAAFPGPMDVDLAHADLDLTPATAFGPVLDLLLGLGDRAAAALAARTTDSTPSHRLLAVAAFTALPPAAHLDALVARVYDVDGGVRQLAARALAGAVGTPGFADVVAALSAAAGGEHPAQIRHAIEALGRLGHLSAGPALVGRLADPVPELADAARQALVQLCRIDFGAEAWQWTAWLEQHAARPRLELLIDGLTREQRGIRLGAAKELRARTGLDHGFDADLPLTARQAAVARWRDWWQRIGALQFL